MISGNRRRGDIEHQEKTFTDYAAAVKRRLTVALVSFVVVLVGGVYLLTNAVPAKYRSTGVISIEQQDVSRDLVQTAVTTYADEQIELVWQKVMSPVTLPAIVEKYGLYPDIVASDQSFRNASLALRDNTLLERQSIQFRNPQSGRTNYATIAFSLSFDHADAVTAQQIATELVNLYLTENIESRSNQAQLTVDFLTIESEGARAEVDRAGAELARFKDRHAGNLPELLNFHLQSIERTDQQLDNIDREIRDSRNRSGPMSSFQKTRGAKLCSLPKSCCAVAHRARTFSLLSITGAKARSRSRTACACASRSSSPTSCLACEMASSRRC